MKERQRVRGTVHMVLRDAAGAMIDSRRVDNLITDAGRNLMARYLVGAAPGTPTLTIAVGLGTTAPAGTDVALQSEVQRAVAALPQVTQNHVATVGAELVAQGAAGDPPLVLTEAGILIGLPGESEVLYNRVVFQPVNKGPTMSLTLTWDVTF